MIAVLHFIIYSDAYNSFDNTFSYSTLLYMNVHAVLPLLSLSRAPATYLPFIALLPLYFHC